MPGKVADRTARDCADAVKSGSLIVQSIYMNTLMYIKLKNEMSFSYGRPNRFLPTFGNGTAKEIRGLH